MLNLAEAATCAVQAASYRARRRHDTRDIACARLPPNSHFTLIRDDIRSPVRVILAFSVEDSSFVEDLGYWDAPDLPRSPDPPRSSGESAPHGALAHHRPRRPHSGPA